MRIYTVGYAGFMIETFVEALRKNKVTAVVDVRSQPYSRFKPEYNKEALESLLKARGLSYAYLGRECGARPEAKECYVDGRVSFARLAGNGQFRKGLESILELAVNGVTALMCAEKDPIDCHRAILISRELAARGEAIGHVLPDGGIEDHAQLQQRLLRLFRLDQDDMFTSFDDRLAEAYEKQAGRIAFQAGSFRGAGQIKST